MLSASSVRRRSVKFTDRPPQIVRYSYHAGADASTSLFAANSAVGAIMPLTRNRLLLGTREPNYANYNPDSAESLYNAVPARNSPVVNNVTVSTPTARRYPVAGANISRVVIGEPNNVGYISVQQCRPESHYQHPSAAVLLHNHRKNIVFEKVPEKTVNETADEFEEINLHIFDCSSQFTEAINKVIQAKQFLVDNESKIPLHDYDKLLKKVDKVIVEGRNRLAVVVSDAVDSDTSLCFSKSNRLNSSSTPTATTTASPSPTSMANVSSNSSELVLDASFIQRHGPQLMHLLQSVCNEQNMAKRN